MSQPPQSGWGPDQPYGQSSPNGGYGDYGQSQQDGYGQPSPAEGYGGYGQDPSAASPSFGPSFGETEPAAPEKKNTTKIAVIEIGRASCREREEGAAGVGQVKKKEKK